ncbi:MAG: hypothetical protein DME57_09235 [Verrucomicrobia bacterium]|nr:MAG: hypothetical protein DME57_09235 [Verrucomicrobiota bacterium]
MIEDAAKIEGYSSACPRLRDEQFSKQSGAHQYETVPRQVAQAMDRIVKNRRKAQILWFAGKKRTSYPIRRKQHMARNSRTESLLYPISKIFMTGDEDDVLHAVKQFRKAFPLLKILVKMT